MFIYNLASIFIISLAFLSLTFSTNSRILANTGMSSGKKIMYIITIVF